MATKRFTYDGPVSSVTIRTEGGEAQHIRLAPDAVLELPDDHAYVRTLLARGHLKPVAMSDDKKPTGEKPTGDDKTKKPASSGPNSQRDGAARGA